MKKRLSSAILLSLTFAASGQFVPGDLAVLRVGDGSQTLANTGNTVFIDEYNTLGTLESKLQLPDSGTSALIISGSATSEGALSRSPDGHYLTVAGYNTPRPYSSSLASSASSSVARGIGTIDANRSFSLAATTTSQYSANNLRGAATDGANNFWGAGANSGTYYFGSTMAGATVQSTTANTRVIQDIGGNLYLSTGSGTQRGIWKISGNPTGASAATFFLNTGASSSPYDFAFNNQMTIAYVADDTASTAGGIQRWDFNGTSWTLSYTLGTGVNKIGARGLAVDFSGANPLVYATTAEDTADRLIEITDTGAGSLATTLATASNNELFRGLDFTPVPEPSTLALLGLGVLALLKARRISA
jgi:hypothetical protein